MGTPQNLLLWSKTRQAGSDGTFASSSKLFKQLYIFHGQVAPSAKGDANENLADDKYIRERNILKPLIYVFSTHKTGVFYEEILKAIKAEAEKRFGEECNGPERWLTDFELAATNAITKVRNIF